MNKVVHNLKNNIKFIFSAICFLIFILNPFDISSGLIFAFLLLVLIFSSLSSLEFKFKLELNSKKLIDIIAYICLLVLFIKFKISWPMTSFIMTVSNTLDISREFVTYTLGILLYFCSVKFVREILRYIVYSVYKVVEENIKVKKTTEVIFNLKKNSLILMSALAYFCYEIRFEFNFYIGLIISILVLCLIFSQLRDLNKFVKEKSIFIKILSLLSTFGICIYGQETLFCALKDSLIINLNVDTILILSMACSVVSSYYIYILMLFIWNGIFSILKARSFFNDITKIEKVTYTILLILNIIFIIKVFSLTDGFYGTNYNYDFIYTSDSPSLIRDNAYLSLTYLENDIRQPLFAVFASPFMAIPYLISEIFSFNYSAYAILLNIVQIIILFFSNYLLAKIMNLSSKNRLCFMLVISFTYTHLLSILMMEQYIISYFWLMLFFYSRLKLKENNQLTLWASGSTLLTNFSVLPFLSKNNIIKNTKNWLVDMIKYVVLFVVLLLMFNRFDLFFNLNSNVDKLSLFTGKDVLFIEQFYQYFNFISSIFVGPNAGENLSIFGNVSWQLNPATSLNFIGILIFILSIISLYINRNNKTSLVAGGWILLSLVMLLGLGWGTMENGLILYVLYFGWAFFVLIYQFLEKIGKYIKSKNFILIVSFLLIGILLYINVPAIYELIQFSIEKFPL